MNKKMNIPGLEFYELKNIFRSLLIITLILNLSGSVSADGVMKVSPPITNVSVNDTFNISVNMSSEENMQGGTFDLWFNNSILNATSIVKGSFMTCATIGDQLKINNSAGKVHFAVFCIGSGTVTGEGPLATITFKAISGGISNLGLKNAYITDANADPMTTAVQNGSVNANTPPMIGAPTINNTAPYTNDIIECINGSFYDADEDSAAWYYKWYDDGVEISGQTSDTLDLSAFGLDKGDNITCSVIADDGSENASNGWQNSSSYAIILNTPPAITGVDVTPDTPNTTSVLTCTPSGWSDADSDSANYYYAWYDSTSLISGQTGPTLDCEAVAGCDKGDAITCKVTPYDGEANGTAVNGSEIIENIPPAANININQNWTYAKKESLIFNGSDSYDPDGTIVNYSWNFGTGEGNGTGAVASHTYNTPGNYTVTLTVTDDNGAAYSATANVTVYLQGDADHNWCVELDDLALFVAAYLTNPEDVNYNSNTDFTNNLDPPGGLDYEINAMDLAKLALNYNNCI